MADVTVTAADVRPHPGYISAKFLAAGALAPGDVVYLSAADTVQKADADAAASAQAIGVVVSCPNGAVTCAAGDMVDVALAGSRVTGFSSLTYGTVLYVSTTAGKLSDARYAGSSGKYAWVMGIALNATDVLLMPFTDTFAAL